MEEIIDFTCPFCGHNKSTHYINKAGDFGICVKCGRETFEKAPPKVNAGSPPIVLCPYCGHYDTKKISKASKVGSVALWGVYGLAKASKEWHCNNCGSDF